MYAAADAKRAFFSSIELAGKVSAEMCEPCGCIALRGVAKNESVRAVGTHVPFDKLLQGL